MNLQDYRIIALSGKEEKMKSDQIYVLERRLSSTLSYLLYKYLPFVKPNQVTLGSVSFLCISTVVSISVIYNFIYPPIGLVVCLLILYSITILDKIDGELARVMGQQTQIGLYYDRAVHFLYPMIFYLAVGTYFLSIIPSPLVFFFTILVGLITQQFILFKEARLLIGDKIRTDKMVFTDHKDFVPPKKKRPNIFFRLIDYTTFMLYSFTIFFYFGLVLISLASPLLAYALYVCHLIISFSVNGYRVFISYPNRKLYSRAEAEDLLSQ